MIINSNLLRTERTSDILEFVKLCLSEIERRELEFEEYRKKYIIGEKKNEI